MKLKQILPVWLFALCFCLCCAAGAWAQENEPTFNLLRNKSAPDQFDLIISDGDERVISGTFTKAQMGVFLQVLTEARKFALSEEEVGKDAAKTTRIASTSQPELVVDISKSGDISEIYLTFTTEAGQITVNAGRARRSLRREYGLFYNLLSRLESLLPPPKPPAK